MHKKYIVSVLITTILIQLYGCYSMRDISKDELAKLKRVGDINNLIERFYDDLVICTANENHAKELAELWANLAAVQQIIAPERFNFAPEGKDWQSFVRKKISKKNNLLLVMHKKDDVEIRGFLYLQTVTIPSSDLILKGIVEDIYTKPQYRRQEVAFKLLDTATHWAQSQNIKQILPYFSAAFCMFATNILAFFIECSAGSRFA